MQLFEQRRSTLHDDICVHIFTASAGLVGVCLTVIGIIRVVISLRKADLIVDDLLACDAILYLVSCLLAYWALRSRSVRRNHRLERLADLVFLLALTVTVVGAGMIAWAISVA
jgi:hypothetical protein